MARNLILASGSATRRELLRNAGLSFDIEVPHVDEAAIRESLVAEGAPARDVADALAEAKARRISAKRPGAMVLGCDQVLDFAGELIAKPETPEAAREQLARMRGKRHQLLSAAVIYEDAEPIWRHVGVVRMAMREVSDAYLDTYVARNWNSIRHSVGAYKLEEEGVRLFSQVQGDYFSVLGLPLLDLLSFLILRGDLET